MKFDWRLSRAENLKRWQQHQDGLLRTPYLSLSCAERDCLEHLNQQLFSLEKRLFPDIRKKYAGLTARVNDPNDWLDDFELDIEVTFYLREDDPEYEENCDNVLTQFSCSYQEDLEWGFGWHSENYMEPYDYFAGQRHCYTYHQLYDHQYLDWRDLLRIGRIELNIKVEEQMWEGVSHKATSSIEKIP